MFPMDLNKGKSWVGNIYHQFEAICQDVDGFMTKETVKYVENHVHNVGASVKRFYSDVQDKLPSVGKNVKQQETSATAKQINVTEDQLVLEQGSIDPLRANESTPSGHHAPQITKLPLTDLSQEIITDLPSGNDDDATTWNDADYGFEDYITRDLTPENADTNSDQKISETCVDRKTFMPPMAASPAISISNAEISVIRKDMFDGFSDDKESQSNILIDGWLFEDELLPIVKSSNSDEIEAREENSLAMDPLLSACNACHKASIEDGTLCDSCPPEDACVDVSSTVKSTELLFSYFSRDDDEGEMGFVFSTCSASPKASNIVEFISEDFTHKVENICNDHLESNRHACTSSTPSCTTIAYETAAMDMLPLMDSNDVISSAASESVSTVGLCQSRHEHYHEDAHSKFDFFPSDIGSSVEFGVDVTDCEMETVDLSNNVNHDKKSPFLNCNFAHPTSHRGRNFRYYKNLIQDAFASRKRLSKEYEHLGILYGDIDMESRHNFELSSLHLSPNAVNEARTHSLDMSECDWELL